MDETAARETPAEATRAGTPRLVIALVLIAAVLGLLLRLAYIDVRSQEPPARRGGWRSRATLESPLNHVAWLHDEQLYYLSTAANAFRGDGFEPDYNNVQDGIYVPPPLQSVFILGVFKAAGRLVEPVTLLGIQAVIAALMVLLAAKIGHAVAGWPVGVALAFFTALFPDFIYWTAYLFTENNYLAILVLLVLLLVNWTEHPTPGRAALAALVLGLLHLQRVNAAFVGPLMAAFALVRLGPRRAWRCALIFVVLPVLVLVPWLVRNIRLYGEPIWVNSNAGVHVWIANHPRLDARATPYMEDVMARGDVLLPRFEQRWRRPDGKLKITYYRYSQLYSTAFRRYVFDQPLHFLRNYGIKLWNQFVLVQDLPRAAWPVLNSKQAYAVLHRLLLVGGLVGLGLTLWKTRRPSVVMLALLFAYFAAMGGLSILVQDGRYNITLKLFLMLFLCTGAVTAVRAFRGPGRPSA